MTGMILKAGSVLSDAKRHVAPEKRNMGIVFQSYALWPNMTVADNAGLSIENSRPATGQARGDPDRRT